MIDTKMTKLLREQPETLFCLVAFANRNAGQVPSAKELASIMNIHIRTASARIKRLVTAHPECFLRKGRTLQINYDNLCTEKESAEILIKIFQIGRQRESGRVPKSEILEFLACSTPEDGHEVIKKACKSGYLQDIPANSLAVRAGPKTAGHIEYLKKLATGNIIDEVFV